MIDININYARMQQICTRAEKYFWKIGNATDTVDGKYLFINNNSKILAIAHLDTVQKKSHFYRVNVGGDTWVLCPWLDDRLGAYVILDLLPTLKGVKYDILLTTGEESGRSTARHFESSKQYNWMFSFDRAGDDVVCYQYQDTDFVKMLTDAGMKRPSHGSMSDIGYLDHLKCRGFNVGTGLTDGHSVWAKANMSTLQENIEYWYEFYKAHKKDYIEYTKPVYVPPAPTPQRSDYQYDYGYFGGMGVRWTRRDYDYQSTCEVCGIDIKSGRDLCKKCAKHYGVCIVQICRQVNPKRKLTKGICPTCFDMINNQGWFRAKTVATCRECKIEMFGKELLLYDGLCSLCYSKRLNRHDRA